MKLKLAQTRTEEIEVDVEFPIYRQHYVGGDGYSSTIFTRIDEDGTFYEIDQRQDGYEIEIGKRSFDPRSGLDYSLGRGEYACTPEEFEAARAAAVAYLARIPVGT